MFDMVPFRSHNNITKRGDAFDRLFDYLLEQPMGAVNKLASAFKVDVKDHGLSYELIAELPGVQKEEIALHYEQGYLTICANREDESENQTENYICRERQFGKIQRSFYISDIDEAKIGAEFKDGILCVTLPKVVEEKSKKQIEIK